jgi:photosystem II stability/assembly factor-like uncharacterized protein
MKNGYKIILLTIFNSVFLILNCFSQQWTSLNSGTSNFLFNVNFPSNDTGYIVQDNGFLRNSVDGGQSWSLLNSNALVYDISFITNDTGWAISGNEILKTENGGIVWDTSYLDQNAQFYWKIYAYSSNSIYAIGINTSYDSAIVTRSMDGGISWIRATFLIGFGIPNAISFPQPSTGYMASASEDIYKSIDSGQTWNMIYSGPPNAYNSVYFISPDTGFIMSTIIQMTTDGGATWNIPNTNGINTAWYDMKFINSMTGFVVGGNGISSGSILKTIDGGFNWDLDTSNVQTFNAIYFTASNIGFTCGTNGVLLKYNGNTGIIENYYLKEIEFSPNPLNTQSKLTFKNNNKEKFLFTLYDITGRITESVSTITNEIILIKGSKQAGVYLFNLMNEKTGERMNGKIAVSD